MTACGWTRTNYGRGHGYKDEAGTRVSGVTTVINQGLPKPNLVTWAAGSAADYAVNHWDELLEAEPSARHELLKWAHKAQRNEAANRGTEIHRFAALLASGEEVEPPDELAPYVESCAAFLQDFNVAEELTELVIHNHRWRYAGTLDLIALILNERWLIDWKSGGKGIFPDVALQLAGYANAEHYIDAGTGETVPMPAIDRAGAVWLRPDGYEFVPVDRALADGTFRTFLHAYQVAAFADSTKERGEWLGDAIRPEALGFAPRLEVIR